MKKLITIVLAISMIFALFVLPSSAAATITEADAAAWKYTIIMQTINGYSYSADDVLFNGKNCMRGMAVSQDGKYLFGGFLNPGGTSAVEMFETATGKLVSGYQYVQPENSTASYPKGLATDDRGYVYVGLAYNPNYGRADFAILDYSSGQLTQLSYTNLITTSEPVKDGGIKTGVNGVTVENINGTYYAYVIVNYAVDYLIRVNVTDPANPVLDTSFGTEGRINLQEAPYNTGSADDFDANYLDVDTDGTIYLAYAATSAKKVFVLSADGKTVQNTIDCGSDKAYGVALYGNYVFVTMQNTGKVSIFDKTTLAPVANIVVSDENIIVPFERNDTMINVGVSSLCNITVINDIMFLGDQGSDTKCDQILAVGLTPEAAAVVEGWAKGIYDRLDAIYPEQTEGGDTTKDEAPVDTPDADTTKDEAPVDTPDAETTKAEAPADTTTDASEKGCGSVIAGGAVLLALFATAVVLKKRD